MDDSIKREEVGGIARKLNECQSHLKRRNIFSCLISFREALEKMLHTKMLASDEKALSDEINMFQQSLASSSTFRNLYGPVTFRDDEFATSLDFLNQLITIKEEETNALMVLEKENDTLSGKHDAQADERNRTIRHIRELIEKGDYAAAQEAIAGDEDIVGILVEDYNASGISYRREERYDEALSAFQKALLVSPHDEGLYYNLSRVYIAKEEWKAAEETIDNSLKINPMFAEGTKLLKYIQEHV